MSHHPPRHGAPDPPPAAAASAGVTLGDLIMQALTRHSSSEAFVAGDRRLTFADVRGLLARYVAAPARRDVGVVSEDLVGALVSPHLRFVTGTVIPVDGGAGTGMGARSDSPAPASATAGTP